MAFTAEHSYVRCCCLVLIRFCPFPNSDLPGVRSHLNDTKFSPYRKAEAILWLWSVRWQDLLHGYGSGLFVLDILGDCFPPRGDRAGSAFPIQKVPNFGKLPTDIQ